MTASTSLLAYQDCVSYMDRALEDPKGVRFKVRDEDAAIHQRSRMHYARKLHREENVRVYSEQRDHPMYGKSPYDALVVKIKQHDDGWYLYLERTDIATAKLEALSELPEQPQVEYKPTLQIEFKPRATQTVHTNDDSIVKRRL